MARTTHDIGVDPIHDEIVVPNPFAQAILIFRGGADGEEKPIRVIQGPKTQLGYTDVLAIDAVHREIFVPQFRTDSVLVFSQDASGDVAPLRIIHGPKTKLDRPGRPSVDPVNNLFAVSTMKGVWIFDRTANGDTAPRYIIRGPKTGIGEENFAHPKVVLYPEGKKIFYAGRSVSEADPAKTGEGGMIAVWKYGDNGDVPPWMMLKSTPVTKLKGTTTLALDPVNKDVMVGSGGGVMVYHLPEMF